MIGEAAKKYAAAGLSPIPARDDKRPACAWKRYQRESVKLAEVDALFRNAASVAVICGKVSGGLEVVDVDVKADPSGRLIEELPERLEERAPGLLSRIIVQETISGGAHLIYRIKGEVEGNKKLAMRPPLEGEKMPQCLIETRGEGGYIIVAPSAGYAITSGSFEQVPMISKEDRDLLIEICKSFDRMEEAEEQPLPTPPCNHHSGLRVGDTYNALPDVADRLLAAFLSEGWQQVSQDAEKWQLRRPGKAGGSSCTLYRTGAVKNFSTSTNLETERAMTPFHVLALLKYSGDQRRCAADLAVELGMNSKQSSKSKKEPEAMEAHESLKKALPQKEPKQRLPEPVRFSDVAPEALKPNPVLIKGCLYQGGKMMIAAPSKARKSWLLMDLCAAVANGADWLGLETLKTPVLFVNLELFAFDAGRRMKSICEARDYWDHDSLHVWNLRGKRVSFDLLKEQMAEYCAKHGIGMIALDPYYRLGEGRDENDNGAIADFLIGLGEIADQLNAAVVMTHHFAKGNSAMKSAIDRMSGAGSFARDPDVLFSLTEHNDSTFEAPVFLSEVTVRSFAPIKPFGLRWNYPVWHRDDALGLDLKGSPGRPKANGSFEDIVSLISNDDEEVPVKELKTSARDLFGISHGRFYDLLNEAIEAKQLIHRKEGRNSFYKLNPSNASKNDSGTLQPAQQLEIA